MATHKYSCLDNPWAEEPGLTTIIESRGWTGLADLAKYHSLSDLNNIYFLIVLGLKCEIR